MTTTTNANVMETINKYENGTAPLPGETTEQWANRIDINFNDVKVAFGNMLHTIGNVFGYTRLRDDIVQILQAGTQGDVTEGKLKAASKEVQRITKEHIDFIIEYGNEDSIKKALALKELLENGDRNIFEALFSAIIYVTKKVNKKLRKIFKIEDDVTLFQACCHGFSAFIGKLREGFTWVTGHAKNILSLMVAGSVKLGQLIVNTFRYGFHLLAKQCSKLKNALLSKLPLPVEDDFEDDFFEEEEIIDKVTMELMDEIPVTQ